MPSPEVVRGAVDSYIRLLNEGDRDRWVSLFAADATVVDPVPSGAHTGRQEIGAFYDGITTMADRVSIESLGLHVCGDEVGLVYRMSLRAGDGGGMAFEGIEIFTVGDNGLIRSARAYWEPTAIYRLEPEAA